MPGIRSALESMRTATHAPVPESFEQALAETLPSHPLRSIDGEYLLKAEMARRVSHRRTRREDVQCG